MAATAFDDLGRSVSRTLEVEIAGLISPPEGLPTTGSGGLSDDSRPEGTSPWFLALASALAFAVLLGGLRSRFGR